MRRLAAAGPLLALLLVFGAAYVYTNAAPRMFMWDEAEYASLGRSLARGEGYAISGKPHSLRPPVLPLVAAAAIAIGGSVDAALKWIPIGFSLLALLITYWCAAKAYDRLTGVVAAVVLGLSPVFWRSTGLLLTEMPFMACFAGAAACFYFGLHRHERWFYASWLLWAASFLTRYTAVLFAFIAVAFTIIALLSRSAEARARIRSRPFFLAPGLGLLAIAPWLVRQYVVFGDPLIGAREAATQLQRFLPHVSMPWHFYVSQMPELLSIPLAVLVLAGTVWAVLRRDRFALHCLLACAVVLVWMSLYRFKELRMAMSVLPLLSIVAAVGLTRPLHGKTTSLRAIAVPAVALGLLFALQLNAIPSATRATVTLGYPSFLDAMAFVRAHSTHDAVVVGANYPQIHWYADRRAVDLPERTALDEALAMSEWTVLTNFERGQKPYAAELVRYVRQDDVERSDAAIFQDGQFQTVLIRSSLLRERLP